MAGVRNSDGCNARTIRLTCSRVNRDAENPRHQIAIVNGSRKNNTQHPIPLMNCNPRPVLTSRGGRTQSQYANAQIHHATRPSAAISQQGRCKSAPRRPYTNSCQDDQNKRMA